MAHSDDSNTPSAMNLQDILDLGLGTPDSTAVNLPSAAAESRIVAPSHNLLPHEAKIEYQLPLQQRIGSLLDNKSFTDVKFLLGELKEEISAHKLILAISSPVFESMFYSALDSNSVIEIPDCKPDAFQHLLQFVYKLENPPLCFSTALDVLYAARKYFIKDLEDHCLIYMSSNINSENVFEILHATTFYDLPSLDSHCWEFIEEQPKDVLNCHIDQLDLDQLCLILKNDRLKINEYELFDIVVRWAEIECLRQSIKPTLENKRKCCEEAFKLIRFPSMNPSDFADIVVPTGILTTEEVARILTYICASSEYKPRIEFNAEKRTPRERNTFKISHRRIYHYVTDEPNRLFTPDLTDNSIITMSSRRRQLQRSRNRRHHRRQEDPYFL